MMRLILVALVISMAFTAVWRTAHADSVSYGYDALGRLTTITYYVGVVPTTTITYTYDAAGNRTRKVITCPGATC
jgi:hypothetical protein